MIPAERTERSVVVFHPLAYFVEEDGTPQGLCVPARLEVGGVPAGRVRIGVYEPEVGGTTDVWRATTWSAALVTSHLTDFDPRAMQMSLEVPVSTDGPSAGALLTVALIAAMRGDALRPEVTMTGTINPDGMIGPVGGIPYKIEGAAQAHKTVVLVPAGSISEFDSRAGREVNLVEVGRQHGIEVVPVSDLWEAYFRLTGVELPRHAAAELATPSARLDRVIRERIERWTRMIESTRLKYYGFPEFTRTEFSESLIEMSNSSYLEAQRLSQQGDLLAAYVGYTESAGFSWAAHELARYTHVLQTQGPEAMQQLPLNASWISDEIDRTSVLMREFQPRTVDQLGMYLAASSLYFEALCADEISREVLGLDRVRFLDAGEGTDLSSQIALFTGVFQVVAWVEMKQVADLLEMAAQLEGQPLVASPNLTEFRHYYRRSAETSLLVLDETYINRFFAVTQLRPDTARPLLYLGDALYGSVHVGLAKVLDSLESRLGSGPQLDYVTLSATLSLHSRSATLFAKYYSIGIEMNDSLQISRVVRADRLTQWLDQSEEQCRRSIGRLSEAGVDPTTCLHLYRLSQIREQREPEEQFLALEGYFFTNLLAELLTQIGSQVERPAIEPPTLSTQSGSLSLKYRIEDTDENRNREPTPPPPPPAPLPEEQPAVGVQ